MAIFAYIGLAVIFVSVITYMIVYSSRLKGKQETLDQKGRLPASKEEGIAVATQKKEREGRTGTID